MKTVCHIPLSPTCLPPTNHVQILINILCKMYVQNIFRYAQIYNGNEDMMRLFLLISNVVVVALGKFMLASSIDSSLFGRKFINQFGWAMVHHSFYIRVTEEASI